MFHSRITSAFTVRTAKHGRRRPPLFGVTSETRGNHSRNKKSKWFTCSTTKELIAAIETLVEPHHKVAELGSQQLPLVRQTLQSITSGLSIHANVIMRQSQESHDSEKFKNWIEIPTLDDWRTAFVGDFDVLVLDLNGIGGNDLQWSSLSIVQEFTHRHNAGIVLVKSESLNQLALRLIHAERWNNRQDPTRTMNDIKLPKIIASVGVDQYRATIPHTVQPGDSVLELGCHLGTTTDILYKAASYTVGVDIGPKIIASARKRFPDVPFVVGDAWKTGQLLQLNPPSGFDVIYVDVGGLSGADGLLEALFLLSALLNAMEPRCIVVKSLCMRRLSSKLIPFWRLSKHQLTKKASA